MLTNRSYAGDMEQGRHKKVSYKSKKTVWIPKKDWIVVPGTHEGIIERDSFERVQQMLRAHAQSGGRGTVNPHWRGRWFCGICGCDGADRFGLRRQKNRKGEPLLSLPHFRRDKTRCPGAELYADGAAAGVGMERTRSISLSEAGFEAERASAMRNRLKASEPENNGVSG